MGFIFSIFSSSLSFIHKTHGKGGYHLRALIEGFPLTFSFFTSSTSGRLLRSNRYTTVAQHRIGISLLKKDLREELVLVLYNADGIRKCSCPFRLRLRPKKLAGTAERSLLHMIDGGKKKYGMRWMINYFE